MERRCEYCQKELLGRSNKLYHYRCKVKHNNALQKLRKELKSEFILPIDHNYNILASLDNDEGIARVNKQTLLDMGFDFTCVNRFVLNDRGGGIGFIYDYFILYPPKNLISVYNTSYPEKEIKED